MDPEGQGSGGTPGAERGQSGKGGSQKPSDPPSAEVAVPGARAEAMNAALRAAEKKAQRSKAADKAERVADKAIGAADKAAKAVEKAAKDRKRAVYERRIGPKRIVFRGVTTALFAWWLTNVGGHPGVEFSEVAVGVATGIAGLATIGAVSEWAEAMARPLPPALPSGPGPDPDPGDAGALPGPADVPVLAVAGALPPVESAAYPPMERLARLERSLAELLTLLGGAAPEDVGAEASRASATLREYGARLRVVESARDGVTGDAAAGVDAAVETLRGRIEEGVSGYERLVAVAADAVSVGTADGLDDRTVRRLEDAADALAGLARGLRELRGELT